MTIPAKDRELIRACSKDEATFRRLLDLYDSHHAEAQHYDFIYNNVQNIIFETDAEGNWILLSPAWEAITGFSVSESIGKHFMDYVHPEDREHNLREFRTVIDQRMLTYHREIRCRTRDGGACYLDVNARLMLDDNGQLLGTVGIFRDITERKQMEDRLRRSEANVRAMLDSTIQSFTLVDRERRVVDADEQGKRSAERIFGKRLEAGESIYDFVLPRDHESFTQNFQRALRGEIIRLEKSFPTADGESLYFEIVYYPVTDEDGTVISVCMSHQNITERKQMEDRLRESEAYLQSILNLQSTLVMRTDMAGRYTYINDALYKRFKWMYPGGKATMIGMDSILTIVPEDHQNTYESVMACIEHPGQPIQVELRKPMADGGVSWYLWDFVALTNSEGDVTDIQCVGIDITARKKATQHEFELSLEHERRKLLTSFIQGAAHEFRTPLATINTSAYIMSRTDNHDRFVEKHRDIEFQVKRITHLLDMLLSMVKLENTDSIRGVPVDLGRLIGEIHHRLKSQYGAHPRLQVERDGRSMIVRGDADYITDALTHVIDNAYRFTPPDGTITVTLQSGDAWVDITVRDTGIGITPENQAHIFETFWRQDTAHSTPGFGLGLPIAQKIITLHGGNINVESAPDEGTTVHIVLPRTPA